jgi:hypothetical protein
VGLEADLMDIIHSIGHGPKVIDMVEYEQDSGMTYPKGRMFCIFTECVPGDDLDEIKDRLAREDCLIIRFQLFRILNEMGKAKRVLNDEHLSFFRYDRQFRKL